MNTRYPISTARTLISTAAMAVCVTSGMTPLALHAHTLRDEPAAQVPQIKTPADSSGGLGGPKVDEATRDLTLVKRDALGRLERLERRPEHAAAELLALTPAEYAPVEKLLVERAAEVSALLKEHYALFEKLQGSRQGGASRQELAPLMREFRPIAQPLISTPLAEQISVLLPERKRTQFAALVKDYNEAFFAEQAEDRGGKSARSAPGQQGAAADNGDDKMDEMRTPTRPRRAQRGGAASTSGGGGEMQELALLLREMARSLGATVAENRERSDEMMTAVEATPEQQAKIQQITQDSTRFGQALNRNSEQKAAVRRAVMEVLTPEQRRKWTESLRNK